MLSLYRIQSRPLTISEATAMIPKPRICRGAGDKAFGAKCCVCSQEIKAGEEIVSYVNTTRYRHSVCVPKKSVVLKTTEEDDEQLHRHQWNDSPMGQGLSDEAKNEDDE